MRTISMLLLSLFLSCPAAFGQAPTPDSRTLQAILEEIHKLRQDLQATTATVQRAQILLYRMRAQMDVVARVSQRLEETRSELARLKTHHGQLSNFMKQQEEILEQTQEPERRKQIEMEMNALKGQLDQLAAQEPEAEAKEAEYANALRLEQSKLEELQNTLDQLDKKLEGSLHSQVGAQ